MQSPSPEHAHDYKPTGIIPVGDRPAQVMLCGCGQVRSAFIPLPEDAADERTPDPPGGGDGNAGGGAPPGAPPPEKGGPGVPAPPPGAPGRRGGGGGRKPPRRASSAPPAAAPLPAANPWPRPSTTRAAASTSRI